MIKLKIIEDTSVIKDILFSHCIWDRISEDGQKKEEFSFINRPEYLWFGLYDSDLLIGMFFLHPVNTTTIQLHIHILEQYRKQYAFEAGAKIIDWFVNDCPKSINKLVAEIPVIYPDVYHYTQKFGFQNEGINRESYRKNNQIYSQYRLGLTREEAKLWEQRQ